MHITPCKQPKTVTDPELGASPAITDPVNVVLECPVFYDAGTRLLNKTGKPILCSRRFAETVLKALEAKCLKYGWGLVHLGVLAQRVARHENGAPIEPRRWSNQARGTAIDWKGLRIMDSNLYLDMAKLRAQSPEALDDILDYIGHCLRAAGITAQKIELVKESNWHHCGYFDR